MAGAGRISDYALAAGLAGAAFVVSPFGIHVLTGRTDLSFRVNVISLVFTAFLAVICLAVLARGWLRRAFLYVAAAAFPFALLAGLEAGAVGLNLADRLAPLEDASLLANKTPWPKHLLSNSSYYTTPEGFVLYRPWQGDGVAFNALGLRTAMPSPKRPGEWRVAVTGGSAVWGWRVADTDTIPVQVQNVLRRAGRGDVTVYNFGIGGATLRQELALLAHFRERYAIDQVLFYTGGNDIYRSYIGGADQRFGPWVSSTVSFELMKTAVRLQAMWTDPPADTLRWIDETLVPQALARNTLREAIAAANAYCRDVKLVCDFALQPMMFNRPTHTGAEARIAQTLARVYPRLEVLGHGMYRDALAAGPPGHVFDLSGMFEGRSEPHFLDQIHLDEAGYRIVAERLAPIVSARLPPCHDASLCRPQ